MDRLRSYLLQAQQNGEYEGMHEDTVDFVYMDREDLIYYLEWVDEETYKELSVLIDLEDIVNAVGEYEEKEIRKMLRELLDRLENL